jgi:hypothetical protein
VSLHDGVKNKSEDHGVEQAFQACGKAVEEIGFSR